MQIEWTREAENDLLKVEDYLLENWNYKVLENFLNILDKAAEILISGNVEFEKYEDTKYSKFLLTKHNYLIYHKVNDKIIILKLINNFQNPDNNYDDITKV
ncbi:type II toxin-antitoxin system RelE/ParE family toxin [Apibacter sp. HY039]|uniref:type II toxin-antitoxin system RelE/ParE family toxin n=1 Tax=Apibacter sp. HY039 TaxID=2501476 RepID=UPI000FEB7BCD|nr:type II toxin-antitoxin system RelE/ParE family toxin [Apibacter sp. HY039]